MRPDAGGFADALRPRATAMLPRGAGRTYGDSAANSRGTLIETESLDRILSFDPGSGRIVLEAGVTLAEIHRRTLPSGWVVPCCPGTAAVTVGGMIAHDVHGKNHHATGTIGLHVRSLRLLRPEGEVTCSAAAAPELFRATIGGLGLTGLVERAELQLQRVPGAVVDVTRERHASLGEAVRALDELGPDEHGYAWVDGYSVDGDRCRAVTFRARPVAGEDPGRGRPLAGPLAALGGLVPASLFRPATVRAFNRAYQLGAAPWAARRRLQTSLGAFLFPQDDVHASNRVYGRQGVHGHHSLVPDLDAARAHLAEAPKTHYADVGWKVGLAGAMLDLKKGRKRSGLNKLLAVCSRLDETSLSKDDKNYLRLYALYRSSEVTKDRKAPVESFQNDADVPLMLVSLKAGGTGLNLTAADFVFLIDPWWNPAVEAQAIDRAHRIGRTKPVVAYRLITVGTVEERVLELQEGKRELAAAVLDGAGGSVADLSREDLERLLS